MAEPTYQDADLLLRVYDLRRETRLREARDFVLGKASFKDYEDWKRKYPPESKGRRYMGMVFTYWDMVCSLVDRGLLNEDLFNTSNTEQVFIWFRFKPAILGMREDFRFPGLLASLEKIATRHPMAARMAEFMAAPPPRTVKLRRKAKR